MNDETKAELMKRTRDSRASTRRLEAACPRRPISKPLSSPTSTASPHGWRRRARRPSWSGALVRPTAMNSGRTASDALRRRARSSARRARGEEHRAEPRH